MLRVKHPKHKCERYTRVLRGFRHTCEENIFLYLSNLSLQDLRTNLFQEERNDRVRAKKLQRAFIQYFQGLIISTNRRLQECQSFGTSGNQVLFSLFQAEFEERRLEAEVTLKGIRIGEAERTMTYTTAV